MEVVNIAFASADYKDTVLLRDKVMRKPLGLSIYNDDLSYEEEAIIIAIKDCDRMIGTGIMVPENNGTATIRFICVDNELQKGGVGSLILAELEKRARGRSLTEIVMDARVSALEFYKKFDYQPYGEEYLMESAPIPHIKMKKKLQ